MPAVWEVDSYHINVGIGDGSIHVLVYQPEQQPRKAYKCVLIDGGSERTAINPGTKAVNENPLLDMIKFLNGYYVWPLTDLGCCQFDTIVVSHWDEDHYGNLLRTIQHSAIEATANKTGRIPYLKGTGNNPATFFYAPNWRPRKNLNGAPFLWIGRDQHDVGYINMSYVGKGSLQNWFKFCIVRTTETLKLKEDLGLVLGAEFFHNIPCPPNTDLTGIDSLSTLFHVNPPSKPSFTNTIPPAMYCIAVKRNVLGSPYKPLPSSVADVVAEREELFSIPLIIPGESPTLTNQVSIICVIVWPSTPPVRVSQYLAGDAGQTVEAGTLAWLTKGGQSENITTIKVSHHGARSSTPPGMLETANPKTLVLSLPSQQHIHPSWELMWYIWLWTVASDSSPAVLGTKYPHYLAREQLGPGPGDWRYCQAGHVRVKPLDEPYESTYPRYWQACDDLMELINSHMPDGQVLLGLDRQYYELQQVYEKAGVEMTEEDRRSFAVYQLERVWQTICHPSPSAHPSVGQGSRWPSAATITSYDQIQAIVILSRNDERDGTVLHMYRGMPMLWPYVKWKKYLRYTTQLLGTMFNVARGKFYFFPTALTPSPVPLPVLAEKPGPAISGAEGARAAVTDGQAMPTWNFYSESAAVVTGREADPAGTDINEDDLGPVTPPEGDIPPPPSPVVAAVTARDEDGYCLYADVVPAASIQVAVTTRTILSAGPLNTFLSALHCGNLCLTGPGPPQPTGTTPLLASDEFGQYLTQALHATSISILNAPWPYVAGFSFATGLISAGTSDPAHLVFTTAAVEDAFGLAQGAGPPLGIMQDLTTLVFGLDTSVWPAPGTASASLSQLVQYAELDHLAQSPAVVALGSMPLTITHPTTNRRNAVWFEPLRSYRATTRLEMDLLPDARTQLNNYIGAFPGLSITSAFVIARRTSTWSPSPPAPGAPAGPGASISYTGSLTFGGDFVIGSTLFDAAVELLPAQVKLVLVLRRKADILGDIFNTLKTVLGLSGEGFEFQNWLKTAAGNTSFEPPYLRRITVVLDDDPDNKGGTSTTPGLASVLIDMETRVNFSGDAFAVFLITWRWTREAGGTSSNTLEASLWTVPGDTMTDAGLEQRKMLPGYEGYDSLLPPVTLDAGQKLPSSLDLTQMGGFDHLPAEIDPTVTQVTIRIGSGGIAFSGDVVAGPPQGEIPTVELTWLTLNVSYLFGQTGGLNGSLTLVAVIQPAPSAPNSAPTQIMGDVSYDGTTWKLGAAVSGLYGSTLYQFFGPDTQGGIGPLLDNMLIRFLAIEYDYQPGGGASSFAISGNIAIGELTLLLSFTCASKSSWEFKAVLDTSQVPATGTTLSDLLGPVFGPTATDQLPSFIQDIPINPPQDQNAVGFDMVPVAGPAGSKNRGLLFTAWLSFDNMSFQAVQYQGPTPLGGDTRPTPRRVFSMAVNALPTVSIPLVGDIAQPFDKMLLLYVQPEIGDGQGAGVTYGELQTMNAELVGAGRAALPYRVTKKTYADADVVLAVGAHFLLLRKDVTGQEQVVLDYVFYTPSSLVINEFAAVARPRAFEEADGDGQQPGAAKAPYEKKMGPLTVSNMGFKYSDGSEPTLSIIMDASVVLGPISLALLGFSLDLHFTEGVTLFQLPIPGVSLRGLAVAFDRPPVVLAGMLEHQVVDQPGPPPVHLDYYQGAVALSFDPYLFQADGYYGVATSAAGSFKSAFVYFILGGPLVTLEIAQIDDVTGGFGYNTNLQFPNVANVEQFPLLQGASSSSADPSAALSSLINSGWFFPRDGSFWLAAGLNIRAFEMLDARVVAVVEWDPDVNIGLFGIATADMPAANSESATVVHAELGIVATVNVRDGVLKVEGQLAPSSFILNPSCHLTGGFALYQWFGGSNAAASTDGDFVFTVGGYHRGFHPPAQYPNPPRLAISWSLDSSLSITGESYFAITPNLCMAGARLDASLSLGPLSAWFDAYADMLINYKPFFFSADGGISVGVGFTLDLWICTVHISCEIAANLHLEGPPIWGTVYVDFWVFGFSIDFGSREGGNQDAPLSLQDFYQLALQATPNQQPPPPHVYTCNEGLVPSGTATSTPNASDTPWIVRGASFRFTVGFKFAIDSATVITAQGDPGAPAVPPFNVPLTGAPVYARPMHLTSPLSSSVTVTITPMAGTSPRWDVCAGVVKAVPKALWGPYNPSLDPSNPNNSSANRIPDLLNPSNATNPDPNSPTSTLTALTTALTISSPPPRLSKDYLAPFKYTTAFVRDAGQVGGANLIFHYPTATQAAADAAWCPRALPQDVGTEWAVVRNQWAGEPGLGVGVGEDAVRMWAGLSFARWDVSTATAGAAGGDDPILGAAPTGILLAAGQWNFEEDYLEAPRMASVSA